jgi:hypothetical protein
VSLQAKKGNTYILCALPGLAAVVGVGWASLTERVGSVAASLAAVLVLCGSAEQVVVLSFEPSAHPRALVLPSIDSIPGAIPVPAPLQRFSRRMKRVAERTNSFAGRWAKLPTSTMRTRGPDTLSSALRGRVERNEPVAWFRPADAHDFADIVDVLAVGRILEGRRPGLMTVYTGDSFLGEGGGVLFCPIPYEWDDLAALRRAAAAEGVVPVGVSTFGGCILMGRESP